MAIISTVGGADSNSYIDVTYFEIYVAAHPYHSTLVLDDPDIFIPYACLLLESLVTWKGTPYYETQALHFPIYPNADIIPKVVKDAQCELVIYLATNNEVSGSSDFDVIEFGQMRLEPNNSAAGRMLPDLVQAMLAKYGTVKSTNNTLSTVRVQRG